MEILQLIQVLLQETYRAKHGRHDISLFFPYTARYQSTESVVMCLSEVGRADFQSASLVNLHPSVVKMLTCCRHRSLYICTSYYPSCGEPLRQKSEVGVRIIEQH
jgi:hypothetical protein